MWQRSSRSIARRFWQQQQQAPTTIAHVRAGSSASVASDAAVSRTKTLPTISLDDDAHSDKLARAFEEYGCCYLTGHGITRTLESATLASAQTFFAQSEGLKEAIPVVQNGKGFTRGYIGIGKESGSADRIEVKEAFSYGYEWPTHGRTTPFANGLQGPNVWPPEVSSATATGADARRWSHADRKTLNAFFKHMVAASRRVSQHLSQSLFADAKLLDTYCTQGDTISIMRAFHYFPYAAFGAPAPAGRSFIGSSPHTDWGFLTLILQDPVGGLQIYHNDEWIDVPYVPGTLVANAGDYLSLVTDGHVVSPIHRVVADAANDRERYSMVFFYYPDFDAVIPSVPASRQRIGGGQRLPSRGSGDDATQVFNNLLDGTVTDASGCFGDYIMAKWAGVQVSSADHIAKNKHMKCNL